MIQKDRTAGKRDANIPSTRSATTLSITMEMLSEKPRRDSAAPGSRGTHHKEGRKSCCRRPKKEYQHQGADGTDLKLWKQNCRLREWVKNDGNARYRLHRLPFSFPWRRNETRRRERRTRGNASRREMKKKRKQHCGLWEWRKSDDCNDLWVFFALEGSKRSTRKNDNNTAEDK